MRKMKKCIKMCKIKWQKLDFFDLHEKMRFHKELKLSYLCTFSCRVATCSTPFSAKFLVILSAVHYFKFLNFFLTKRVFNSYIFATCLVNL